MVVKKLCQNPHLLEKKEDRTYEDFLAFRTLLPKLSIYFLEKEMLRQICVSDLCGSQRTRKHFRRRISLFQSNKTNLCCLILIILLF